MGPDILVPLSLFGMVVAIVWLSLHFTSRNRSNVLETVREAAKNGQQLSPELVRSMGMPRKNANGDLKAGFIMIAIALSLVTLGWAIGQVEPGEAQEAVPIMMAVASFPGFIGVVLIIFGAVNREKKAKD